MPGIISTDLDASRRERSTAWAAHGPMPDRAVGIVRDRGASARRALVTAADWPNGLCCDGGPMKVLVYWDDPDRRELLRTYLSVDDDRIVAVSSLDDLLAEATAEREAEQSASLDAIVMAIDTPDYDRTFAALERLRQLCPHVPVVGGCPADELYRVARFLTAGMRSYVVCDAAGDFLFLVRAMLEGVVAAVESERQRERSPRVEQQFAELRQAWQRRVAADRHPPPGYRLLRPASADGPLGEIRQEIASDLFPLDDGRSLLLAIATRHVPEAAGRLLTVLDSVVCELAAGDRVESGRLVGRLCTPGQADPVPVWCGVLDPATHELEWTVVDGGPVVTLERVAESVVAERNGQPSRSERTVLRPGSRLSVGIDGAAAMTLERLS